MRRSDFHFELPEEQIAQRPPARRGASRLLALDGAGGRFTDRVFTELPDLLGPDDLLVVNDTRVIPARLYGRKDSGGRVEALLERATGERTALMQIKASKSPRPGTGLVFDGEARATVIGRSGEFYELRFDRPVVEHLERHGHVPLPPYIRRPDGEEDRERYQTVYAARPGAVAAPTAGLHFDQAMLATLAERGIRRAAVTLHVGAGTFQPVRVDDPEQHRMHAEYAEVPPSVVAAVAETRARGGRVVAVGTTVVRSLETAAGAGRLASWRGESTLFIYPGYRFRVVDALVTNFHLPESTLLMLVCAFAGTGNVLAAYRHAVAEGYRFFSYGDAMFVTGRPEEAAG
jgi:S-adenosylmethionine:tRNA ribosyltransferase-isomerase